MIPAAKGSRLEALGLACALGSELDVVFERLVTHRDEALTTRTDLVTGQELLVGEVREPLPSIHHSYGKLRCRNNALAALALQRIAEPVSRAIEYYGPSRVGVIVGTTTSGVAEAGDAIGELVRSGALPAEFHYAQLEYGGLSTFLAGITGAKGPTYAVSTACSSSARALVSARSLLELGLCDAVIAGGVDSLARLTSRGFSALEAVSPVRSQPFSRNRRGLNLGEAATLFLMTRRPGGIRLVGTGESTDAHHMSAPSPDGEGAERAMRDALEDAVASPGDLLYLNLHGTGTLLNDASEGVAVHRVFGATTPCSSTKPRVGHTLGGAGALEAGFCWLVLANEVDGFLQLPPHAFDGEFDPALPALHLVAAGQRARVVGRRLVASNSLGFGGNNCTLVLERTGP